MEIVTRELELELAEETEFGNGVLQFVTDIWKFSFSQLVNQNFMV